MTLVTRDALVNQTREYMDAEGSSRWTDATVLSVLDGVFNEEWSNILNAAPYYTFAERTVLANANGHVALTALNGGVGDEQEVWYRILSVSDGSTFLTETTYPVFSGGAGNSGAPSTGYYIAGSSLQVLPRSARSLVVAVNYKPTPLLSLSSGAALVTFPPHYQSILAVHAAAKLLLKGGAEAQAAGQLRALAESDRAVMLTDLVRRTINPIRMGYPDVKAEWAG